MKDLSDCEVEELAIFKVEKELSDGKRNFNFKAKELSECKGKVKDFFGNERKDLLYVQLKDLLSL